MGDGAVSEAGKVMLYIRKVDMWVGTCFAYQQQNIYTEVRRGERTKHVLDVLPLKLVSDSATAGLAWVRGCAVAPRCLSAENAGRTMTALRHALCGDDFHQTPVSIVFSEKCSKFFSGFVGDATQVHCCFLTSALQPRMTGGNA